MADMSLTKAREIVENPSEYTKQQVRNAKQKVADPAASVQLNAGGDVAKKKKEVPVLMVSVGMGKAQMSGKGKANGKEHKYAAGGVVKDNVGLRALKASGPKGMEAYNKITGK